MSTNFDDETNALNALLLLGFQASAKKDTKGPTAILLFRQKFGHLDTVSIIGPRTCEARRIANGSQSKFIEGDLLTVAEEVKSWLLTPIMRVSEEDLP
jgi:hypothetical protein